MRISLQGCEFYKQQTSHCGIIAGTDANEGTTAETTVWYLAMVACRGSSSCSNTGLATMACRGSSSSSNTGLAVVACRGSSSSSNGLVAVGFLVSINVAPTFSLRPGRRDRSNRYSNCHGESRRSEATGRTEVPPFLKHFSAVMAGLLRSGVRRAIWRCRCSPCRRDRSSRR